MDDLAKLRRRISMTRLFPARKSSTLLAAIDLYVRSDARTREMIRELVRGNSSFAS